MKALFILLLLGLFTSCTNPRLEDDLDALREKLLSIDISKLDSDISDLRSSIADITLSLETIIGDLVESTNESNAELLLSIDISSRLSDILVVLGSATSDQVSVLRAREG